MADTSALLEILVDVQKAKASVADLQKRFADAMAAAQAAAGNVDLPDAELQRLRTGAVDAGKALVQGFSSAKTSVAAARDALTLLHTSVEQIDGSGQRVAGAFGDIAGAAKLAVSAFVGSQIVQEIRDLAGAAVEAQIAVQNIRNALLGATGDAGSAAAEFDFLVSTSRELGTSLEGSGGAFARLTAAARGTKLEGAATRDIFRAISETATTLGLNADQTKDSVRALEQMISKNVISAEELRLQLGDHVPGALSLMAKAAGVTTLELSEMLKNGEVLAEDVLPRFAEELRKAFGPGTESAMSSLRAGLERTRTEVLLLRAEFAEGFAEEVAKSATDAAGSLQGLADAARKSGEVAGVYAEAYGGLANSVLRLAGESDEAVPPLDRLLKLIADRSPVGRATEAFNQLADDLDRIKAAMGLSGDATTELGVKSRDLAETTEQLAEHRRKLAEQERDVAAAMRESDVELQKQVAAGSELAATWNAEWEAAAKVDEALRGNSAALAEQSDLLAERVRLLEESGGVNAAVTERIREEAAALAELAAKYGNELPESLKVLQERYPELAEAQEGSRKSAKDSADQQRDLAAAHLEVADAVSAAAKEQAAAIAKNIRELEGPAAQTGSGDDQRAKLREEIRELESATVLTLEQSERLAQAKNELSDIGGAFAEVASEVTDLSDAAGGGTQSVTDLVAALDGAGNSLSQSGQGLAEFASQTRAAREEMKPGVEVMNNTSDAAERMAEQWIESAAAQTENTEQAIAHSAQLEKQGAAIEGLRQRQDDYVATAESAGSATTALGEAATAAADQVAGAGETMEAGLAGTLTAARELEAIYVRIKSEHLPEAIRLTRELAAATGG